MHGTGTEEQAVAERGSSAGYRDDIRWLFRQLPGAAWITDTDLRITEIIGYVERNLGVTHDKLLGRHVSQIAATRATSDPATAAHVSALAGESSSFRYRLGDHWYEVHVEPLRDRGEPERIIGCIGAAVEITDRVELEERAAMAELRAAERQRDVISLLEATIESTADGILVVDLKGIVVLFNKRFLTLWGVTPEMAARGDDAELLAFVVGQLVDPGAFLERVRALYAEPAREDLDVLEFKDGRIVERYSRPQCVDRKIVGRVWSFRDVTDRNRLVQHSLVLADSSRLLASLDAATALESVARLMIGSLWLACTFDLCEGNEIRRHVTVARDPASGPTQTIPIPQNRAATEVREQRDHVLITVPIRTGERVAGWLTVIGWNRPARRARDIELLEELARRCAVALENSRMYRAAREEIRAREEFVAVASHELRGPVAAIRLAVEGVRSGHATTRFLDILDREERRLERLLDELLDLGRLRSGTLNLVIEPVDLGDVVREVAARLHPEVAHSGSLLTLHGESHLQGHWDRLRLEQIVTNLVSNALKFGDRKPIDVELGGRDGRAVLTISDHGIGIAPDKLSSIFDPFERAVPSRHYGGLGLGLYIVRTIVTRLGGTIDVHSVVGAGTTFVVELPLEAGS